MSSNENKDIFLCFPVENECIKWGNQNLTKISGFNFGLMAIIRPLSEF